MTRRAQHIAIVLPDFSSGGTERTAIRLADAWVRRGRRVTMLCGSERGPARALVAPGITVIAHHPEISDGPLYRVRLARAFGDAAATIEPDLVFGPGNFHVPVLAWMKARMPRGGPPVVCRLSNTFGKRGVDGLVQAALSPIMRIASRQVDALVAMSAALQKEARLVLGREDIAWIAEPHLLDEYFVTPPPPRVSGSTPLIVCVGRLERQKRFELALRAVAALPRSCQVRLTVLGEGSRRVALERGAKRLGISDRVEFAGHVADIHPHLARAKVLLCVSRYEGYPAALVEAIAAGVSVVTTDCSPAIPEIMFDPSFGSITDSDPRTIAKAIEALLDAPGPDIVACARLAEQHRLGLAADAYLALFDRVVADPQH